MKGIEPWWPQELGDPSNSGAQNDMRYAFFAEKRRLLVEANGKRLTYDCGDHQITGVSQSGRGEAAVFDGPQGTVSLEELRLVT